MKFEERCEEVWNDKQALERLGIENYLRLERIEDVAPKLWTCLLLHVGFVVLYLVTRGSERCGGLLKNAWNLTCANEIQRLKRSGAVLCGSICTFAVIQGIRLIIVGSLFSGFFKRKICQPYLGTCLYADFLMTIAYQVLVIINFCS